MKQQDANSPKSTEPDDELDYEKLVRWLQEATMTWLPALLGHIIAECIFQKVFVDDEAMVTMVRSITKRVHEHPDEFRSK